MKILLVAILLLASCSLENKRTNWSHKKKSDERTQKTNDRIILITINKNYSFNWDNDKSKVVEDSLFNSLVTNFTSVKLDLADYILNSEGTNAVICNSNRKIKKGDLVFLVINRIEPLPLLDIFKTQCDVYDNNCPYPTCFIEAIDKDRGSIKSRVKDFLQTME